MPNGTITTTTALATTTLSTLDITTCTESSLLVIFALFIILFVVQTLGYFAFNKSFGMALLVGLLVMVVFLLFFPFLLEFILSFN